MHDEIEEMVDVIFDLAGATPPASYPYTLWSEILRLVPLLENRQAGILPLRLPDHVHGGRLHKRAKLVLRSPTMLADEITASLSDQQLLVDGVSLTLGRGKTKSLLPYPTLHAQTVAGAEDEIRFMQDIEQQMKVLGINGKPICGKAHALSNHSHTIRGYSLVIHDLKAEASLRLQYAGLGGARQYGFGLFIPYKLISGLDGE